MRTSNDSRAPPPSPSSSLLSPMSSDDSIAHFFGFGSLIWRPGPLLSSLHPPEPKWAFLPSFVRLFAQGSTDHRGVPGAPGRVVTILNEEQATGAGLDADVFKKLHGVHGVVYTIEGVNNIRTVLDYLNVREQGGYTQMNLPVYTDESCTEVLVEEAIVFQATPENPEFLGLEPVPVMAATIADSVGPSGPNTEYLLELDDALRAAGRRDDHVAELADAVRALLAQRATSAS